MKLTLRNKIDPHMREVIRGASIAFPIRTLSAALGFSVNVVLARLMGAEGAGIYFLSLSIITIATAIANLGIGNVLVRLVASGAEQNNWGDVRGAAATGPSVAMLAAVLISLALTLSAPWLATVVVKEPDLVGPLRWMAFATIPQTQVMLHAQLLRGMKRVGLAQGVLGLAIPSVMLIGLAFVGANAVATGVAGIYVLACTIAALTAFWLWRQVIRPYDAVRSHCDIRDLLRSGFPLMQVNLMRLLITSTTIILLGAMSTAAAAGIFAVASRTSVFTKFALLSVNSIAAPKFAALHSTAQIAALASTSKQSAMLTTLIAAPVLSIFVIFPHWIMGLFGEQFVDGANVLIVLSLAHFVSAASGSVKHLLMMSGHERLLRNNNAIAAVVSISLNLLLIPSHAALGAAVSVAIAIITQSVLGIAQVYRHLGIMPFFFPSPSDKLNDM